MSSDQHVPLLKKAYNDLEKELRKLDYNSNPKKYVKKYRKLKYRKEKLERAEWFEGVGYDFDYEDLTETNFNRLKRFYEEVIKDGR